MLAPSDFRHRELSLLRVRAERARRHLLPYVVHTSPGYLPGLVHEDICYRLERFSRAVAAGKSPRLMLFMPPRHGKSQIVSRRFLPWHLANNPTHEIILATYGQDLSNDLSRDARNSLDHPLAKLAWPNLELDPSRDAVEQWRLQQGGGLSAAGVGGPITGRGAHILAIDDAVKGAKEAESPVYREGQVAWYKANALTRLAPGGGILLTMTRWHEEDLAGAILADAEPGEWEVVVYPAIAHEQEYLADGRPFRGPGEALHPERYPLAYLQQLEAKLGPYFFSALYDQRPTPAKGTMIQREWLEHTYTEPPARARVFLSIDTAMSDAETADYSVVMVAAQLGSDVYLLDVWRGQVLTPELEEVVRALVETHRPNAVLIEDKAAGESLIAYLRKPGRGGSVPIVRVEPVGNKRIRMAAEVGWLRAGQVKLPASQPRWMADFRRELLSFPKSGVNDDQVDALSQLLAYLREGDGIAGLFRFGRR